VRYPRGRSLAASLVREVSDEQHGTHGWVVEQTLLADDGHPVIGSVISELDRLAALAFIVTSPRANNSKTLSC